MTMDSRCVYQIPAQYLCRGLMLCIGGDASQKGCRNHTPHQFLSVWPVYTAVLDTLRTERNFEHYLWKKKKAMTRKNKVISDEYYNFKIWNSKASLNQCTTCESICTRTVSHVPFTGNITPSNTITATDARFCHGNIILFSSLAFFSCKLPPKNPFFLIKKANSKTKKRQETMQAVTQPTETSKFCLHIKRACILGWKESSNC